MLNAGTAWATAQAQKEKGELSVGLGTRSEALEILKHLPEKLSLEHMTQLSFYT